MDLSFEHIACMLATVALVIGAGLYAARSVHSAEGYSLGGRSAGPAMIAGSIAGTIIGGGATVGTAQLAFSYGLAAWWFTLGSGIALAIMGIFYARRLRATGLATIPELLSTSYGKRSETAASVISSIGIWLSIIASTLPGIQIFSAFFNVPHWEAAGILLLFVIGYAFFGGIKSAGASGMLKMGVIFLALFAAGYGAAGHLAALPDFSLQFPQMPWLSLFGVGVEPALASLFSVIVGVLCTQTYVQAIFSASSPQTAVIGCLVGAVIVIPVGLPSVAIGMFMHAAEPDMLPILVLPKYLLDYEGTVIAGVAMGGILLSLIGSISGLAIGIGTMIARDIFGGILGIRNDRLMLHITRAAVIFVVIAASLVAIANLDSEVLFWNYLSMALRGGGIFIPLTLSVFCQGLLGKRWALASMIVSTAAAILTATVFPLPISPLFVGLIISAVIVLAGILLGRT